MKNIIAIVLGYLTFTISCSLLLKGAALLIGLIENIVSIYILGFIILCLIYEVVFELPLRLSILVTSFFGRKPYAFVITGILILLDVIYIQYNFISLNGDVVAWFLLPGFSVAYNCVTLLIMAPKILEEELKDNNMQDDINERSYIEEKPLIESIEDISIKEQAEITSEKETLNIEKEILENDDIENDLIEELKTENNEENICKDKDQLNPAKERVILGYKVTKVPKEKKKKNPWSIFIIIVLLAAVIFLCYNNITLQDELQRTDKALDTVKLQYDKLQKNYNQIDNEWEFYHNHAVIVAEGVTNYHRYGCKRIKDKSFWIYNISAAEGYDYDPCPECID